MELSELLSESILMLALNKLRTGLAALGIVIGIGSVITLISLGQASQQSIATQIESLGANLLTVSPGGTSQGAVRGAQGGATTLTLDDAKAILTSPQVNTVNSLSSTLNRRAQVITGKNNTNTQIIGVDPTYMQIRKITMSSGSFITQRDLDTLNKVAVLGPTVVTDLFGTGADPVGQTVRVNGQDLRVIGVTESKGGTGFQNQDDVVYIPLSTAQKQIFGVDYVSSIVVEAKSQDVMTDAQNQIGYLLLARHKINNPANADFSILSQNDILSTASQITGTFTTLLSGIAAISLLVGGIGIMNIMLVTVTERTREIGLRKALGAKKKTIITQFLTEAVILTIAGGLIGAIIGVGASYVISKALSLPFTVSSSAILLAFGVSAGTGIIFGWYPASKASGMQPIEALRYE